MSILFRENELNQLRKRNALNALCFFFLCQVAIYYNDYYRCAWGEKKTKQIKPKKYKTFHILPIHIILSMIKIICSHDNKIFHVNNS